MIESNEVARLDALKKLDLLDTGPSETFDRITRMASQIFDLPVSAISLTDSERQWFKSRVGLNSVSLPRAQAPCAEVTATRQTLVINDILANEDYADSPIAADGMRFYAGAPLITRDGYALGSLCVLGTQPRSASPTELAALCDLAEMVMSQIELQHAFGRIDPISGLPNRVQFFEDLEDLGRESNGTRRLAVLVDIARTDQISNGIRVVGSDYVDDVIQTAARVTRSSLGPNRKAYHVAATQFAFLAPSNADDLLYLEKLSATVQLLETSCAVNFMLTVAIGVAPFILGKVSASDVLRKAHTAAHDARASGMSVSLYSSDSDFAYQRTFRLLNDFSAALSAPDQLRLVFQPRIDLLTNECIGAEALLRWKHPELGDISPSEFIPIIEQTSLARSTTAWVIDHALRQLGAWAAGGQKIMLSVNVSASNLQEADFAQQVQLALMKHGVRPHLLELDVTESAVMRNEDNALRQLEILNGSGVQLAIDDFGTGYSSLAYLQRLPVHVVKIDRSFISDLGMGEKERLLVRTMIKLSHDLGYRVVGEGVESAAIIEILTELKCDEVQGYFIARPMEADQVTGWLADYRTDKLPIAC